MRNTSICVVFSVVDLGTSQAVTAIFSPHSSGCTSAPTSCTHLVSAYFVALFQCFRMVPVSYSSRGANKNVQRKAAPLSHVVRSNRSYTTASLHETIRLYNLRHWMSTLNLLLNKTAGKVGAYSYSLVGKKP